MSDPSQQTQRSQTAATRIAAGALLGGLLLVIAQFLPLFETHIAAAANSVASSTVGSAHGWAGLPIGVAAALFAWLIWRTESRPALLAVGLLGIVALVICLTHDLSAARAHGLRHSPTGVGYVIAGNETAAGFYLETAAALLLLVTCVCGFLFIGAPSGRETPAKGRSRPSLRTP